MSRNKNTYITPLAIKLDKTIERKVYYLGLPYVVKEKLIRLEEISRDGTANRGNFIKEIHNLPLNSLKKLLISYLPGISDMKSVSYSSDDSRWIVSLHEIDVSKVVDILRIWIEAFYIEETELDKKRNNKNEAKQYAQQIINEIKDEDFKGCSHSAFIQLFDKGKAIDKDAFSLLPLLAINELIGKEIFVNNQKSYWMYSAKNEIVTDPIKYIDQNHTDYFSFVVNLNVQTIPPFNEAYLNINISSRRWISKNDSKTIPYLPNKKSVYMRLDNNKLQQLHVQYNSNKKAIDWIFSDIKCYETIYGKNNLYTFEEIISNPQDFMKGKNYMDAYIPFEYGMYDGNKKMHNQDAGISHMDRLQIFNSISDRLGIYSSEKELNANRIDGNKSYCKLYFDDYFNLIDDNDIKDQFIKNINAVRQDKKLVFEVWYSSGQEELRNHLFEILENHFIDTGVIIKKCNLEMLSDFLEHGDSKKAQNLEGYNQRIKEIQKQVPSTGDVTMAIIIIHAQDYYQKNPKEDPKDALRVGFSQTGRLTQFVTSEQYEKTEKKRKSDIDSKKALTSKGEIKKSHTFNSVVRAAVLDSYRQLGFLNPLKNKSLLKERMLVGIHVVNFKNLYNGISISPFPIIVTCDLNTRKIVVETKIVISSKLSRQQEEIVEIKCDYNQFPLEMRSLLKQINRNKKIKGYDKFIFDWFEYLDSNNSYDVFIEANGTSRRIINGISNKDIEKVFNSQTGSLDKLVINEEQNQVVMLNKFNNLNIIRVRTNDEVPDYIPEIVEDTKNFKSGSGVYKLETIYYSQEARPFSDSPTLSCTNSKLNSNRAFLHRNIIEIYPMHVSTKSTADDCASETHNIRSISIQYENKKTILPMPLHIAKKIEEYLL